MYPPLLLNLTSVLTYIECFLESRIMYGGCSEAKSHLRSQRCRISPQVIDKVIWTFQDPHQHSFALEVLVWDVGARD